MEVTVSGTGETTVNKRDTNLIQERHNEHDNSGKLKSKTIT